MRVKFDIYIKTIKLDEVEKFNYIQNWYCNIEIYKKYVFNNSLS